MDDPPDIYDVRCQIMEVMRHVSETEIAELFSKLDQIVRTFCERNVTAAQKSKASRYIAIWKTEFAIQKGEPLSSVAELFEAACADDVIDYDESSEIFVRVNYAWYASESGKPNIARDLLEQLRHRLAEDCDDRQVLRDNFFAIIDKRLGQPPISNRK